MRRAPQNSTYSLFLFLRVLRVTNRLPELDGFDCALPQTPLAVLDPLYIKLSGASVAFLPRALRAAGVLDAEEAWLLEAYLIERGEATVPLAAALAPRSWRVLLYLSGWCQEAQRSRSSRVRPSRCHRALRPGAKVSVEAEGLGT